MKNSKPLNVEFPDNEREALRGLANGDSTSEREILRRALRLYQLVRLKAEDGWQLDFVNEKGERHNQMMARALVGLGPLP